MRGAARDMLRGRARVPGICALALLLIPAGTAQTPSPADVSQMGLEDLMHVQVTSVSKKDQQAWKSAAAIFVITQEDIRRSGAVNIPDLLRMVPGVDVAQIDANTWAISIRGFNYRYANKLLVLVDGRSVYTPGFSGVYWDQVNIPLDDIDRIEVIRGPGGTVWGANAVNGVINIITKKAQDTQGGLLDAGSGSQSTARGLVQYGGQAGSNGFYRVYGNYFNVADNAALTGGQAADGWHGIQSGFRSDWNLSARDTVTVEGDYNGTSEGQTITTLFTNRLSQGLTTFPDVVQVGSDDLLAHWTHTFSNGSEASVQMSYSRARRFDQALDILNSGDVQAQYHFHAGSRQDVVTGIEYRADSHSYANGYEMAFGNGYRWDNLYSAFVQDEISVTRTVSFTVGTKVEHNSYTGFEYEPSGQVVWTPKDHQAIWASVSRAIRQPSWLDADTSLDLSTFPLPGAGLGVAALYGNPNLKAEQLTDFEVGYRVEFSPALSLELSTFSSKYENLETVEPGMPFFAFAPGPPHLVVPNYFGNLADARNYGGEASVNWNITKQWRISPGLSYLEMRVTPDGNSRDTTVQFTPGDSPKLQWELRSQWNVRRNLQWDTSAYYVGGLHGSSTAIGPVPAYTRVDTRLGWHIGEFTEISVGGQNLLAPRHLEFADGLQVNPTLVERSFLVNVTRRF